MHEIRFGNNSIYLQNRHVCLIFFFCLSGLGFAGCGFMVLLDMIKWGLE